ncbi:hypothetical protein GCM10028824_41530 [Hymenobacter segetis]
MLDDFQFRLHLLTYIQKHDGEWYWYQLDRALSATIGLNGRQLMKELDALRTAGLIKSQEVAGRSYYFITDEGRRVVAVSSKSQ